ncbi:hypothetical protein [Phaeobacter gallaeciensis]|uniref:hypothetical protein n=1 Tax=Phaeobacter gallaeciensis TaxID=60890 RepID=UPI00237EEAA4|nr:hypothetical protein [Phaeobacter gallaeciensis]MDE4189661.1 hypothetical protein [Phaeobacter gallaeciensis]MDE4198813.1 hypothetical protein [Phaeobacter gallaeciensis]MDE4202960.1 hypothetical protein [Phaeobacter gallaeciensis]MDE4207103.1 hypothetical protein [Phaeobacter gallaeciensis]MDE4215673.1 hypothetical protein [Phaeobacter gallaeciensis]
MNALAYRWFGLLECSREMLRFTWLEISWRLGLALALLNFGDDDDRGHFTLHIHLIWPNIYLRLPFLPRRAPRDQMMDSWGFTLDTDGWSSFHLNWGSRTKIIHMPWALEFYRKSVLMKDGTWLDDLVPARRDGIKTWQQFRDEVEANGHKETHSYAYVLRNGKVQKRDATLTVEEWEWRRRWLMWTPLFAKIRKEIDVQFSGEVGERSGSWKGGCVGCSYEMKPGETPLDTLRRMEKERTFR